ncbi:MAG: 16S rRNA (uracil(1498)-N(3))-methyltransferase [Acidobacteria bacterium]|nr:16S rRNA (uracil(1498)-N(3))-methyltransferase [Acidobacteriota bacterium]
MGRVIRVHIPPTQVGDETAISREDVHHLEQVLRLAGGVTIEGFDGEGGWYRGVFCPGGPTGGRFRVTETGREDDTAKASVSLGLALIRPEPMEWAIQKATELGCRQLFPLISHHVSRRDAAQYIRGRLPRWERIVRESMKQCRRNTVMDIAPPVTATDFFQQAWFGRRLLLHPLSERAATAWWRRAGADSSCLVAIGPEGGWSEAEVDLARNQGFECFGLGETILRTETAALAVLAVLQLAGE